MREDKATWFRKSQEHKPLPMPSLRGMKQSSQGHSKQNCGSRSWSGIPQCYTQLYYLQNFWTFSSKSINMLIDMKNYMTQIQIPNSMEARQNAISICYAIFIPYHLYTCFVWGISVGHWGQDDGFPTINCLCINVITPPVGRPPCWQLQWSVA